MYNNLINISYEHISIIIYFVDICAKGLLS